MKKWQEKQDRINKMKKSSLPTPVAFEAVHTFTPIAQVEVGDCFTSPQGVTYQAMAITENGYFSNITILRDDGMQFQNRVSAWLDAVHHYGYKLTH